MEDLLIAGSLRCPSCGAVQPEDRPVCLECGMHFTAKIQILAARRPLGLPPAMLAVLGAAALVLLVVSVNLSRKPATLVVPEGVDIFAPVDLPPPPAPAVTTVRPATSLWPENPPARPDVRVETPKPPPAPVAPSVPPPTAPAVGENPPVDPSPVLEPAVPVIPVPAEDPAVLAKRREEVLQAVAREWARDQRMHEVGEHASLALGAGGRVEGQISMIGADYVLISFAAERKKVPFSDLAPASRLKIDSAYRRNRIAEEAMLRLTNPK